MASTLGISEPQLPWERRIPRHYEPGQAQSEYHSAPSEYYRQMFYEALDLIIACIKDRFNLPGYQVYCKFQNVLLKAAVNENYEDDLEFV